MFEPRKDHPRWVLALYPYWFLLRCNRRGFFRALTGRQRFWWHYSWESEAIESSADHPDFNYDPGSFIMPESWRTRRK